jgi:transporter family protein
MAPWLINSLVALVCFGLWGFLPKIAVRYISPRSALVYEVLGVVTVGCIVLLTVGKGISTDVRGTLPAVLTGIFGTVGFLSFLYAVNEGSVSVIATLTALYPAITIALAMVFLKETVTLRQLAGIGLAILSVIILSRR